MKSAEHYFLHATLWPDVLQRLRPILLDVGLDEEIKWNKPCYSADGKNILILQEMKAFLAVMFFKGALMNDPEGLLASQGPNSRSAKRIELTSVDDVDRLASSIRSYIVEAIAVEEAGLEPAPAPELELVAELQDRIDSDPAFAEAFRGLTPGRQREYHLQIASAKKAETRLARIEKFAPKILAGKGFRDR